MPLTPEQQQELAELRRLEELDKKYGQSNQPGYIESVRHPHALKPGELANQQQQQVAAMSSAKSPADLPEHMRIGFEAGQGDAAKAAGEPLAKLAGLLGRGINKAGDVLMQKAVGMRRYVPGVGETLADQGVVGTRNMMRGQIENALESTGQELGNAAKSIPEISTQSVAEKLGERASKLIGPDGKILPGNTAEFNRLVQAAQEASQEGAVSGETAAFRRMQEGRIAKNAGRYRDNPAQGLKAQLAGEQQAAYSQALKDASPNIASLDKTYGNLAAADSAMSRPETLSTTNLLGKFIPTSLGESVAGRSAIGLGNAISSPFSQQAARLTPLTLKELLNLNKKSSED